MTYLKYAFALNISLFFLRIDISWLVFRLVVWLFSM